MKVSSIRMSSLIQGSEHARPLESLCSKPRVQLWWWICTDPRHCSEGPGENGLPELFQGLRRYNEQESALSDEGHFVHVKGCVNTSAVPVERQTSTRMRATANDRGIQQRDQLGQILNHSSVFIFRRWSNHQSWRVGWLYRPGWGEGVQFAPKLENTV